MAKRAGFVFEPRLMLATPKQFGYLSEEQLPAESVSLVDPRFRAANLQHLLSYEIRQWFRQERHRGVAWFASKHARHPGMSVDRMMRMLRGETMMQLTDMILIAEHAPKARARLSELFDENKDSNEKEMEELRYRVNQLEWQVKK